MNALGDAGHPLQLTLFEEVPPAASAAGRTGLRGLTPGPEQPTQAAGLPPAGAAGSVAGPCPPASQSASAVTSAMPSAAVFRHPRAAREIQLGEHCVGYAVRRARRRSIGFVIGADGLTVSAPRWVSWQDVDAALREKAAWILRKLQDQRDRARRVEAARIEWCDGARLPFLGHPLTVVLHPATAGAMLHSPGDAAPGAPWLLRVGLPQSAEPEQIRDAVQSWLQRQALRVFQERCGVFALRLGVRMKRLSLSAAQTRWGSASMDGSVRLNWRLIHFAMPVIDYVVAHELAHLREMNHSPAFWEVVRSVLPEFEQLRGRLKDETLPVIA